MPRKKYVYKELRDTIEVLVLLEGIVKIEKELGVVIIGIRRSGIENVKVED